MTLGCRCRTQASSAPHLILLPFSQTSPVCYVSQSHSSASHAFHIFPYPPGWFSVHHSSYTHLCVISMTHQRFQGFLSSLVEVRQQPKTTEKEDIKHQDTQIDLGVFRSAPAPVLVSAQSGGVFFFWFPRRFNTRVAGRTWQIELTKTGVCTGSHRHAKVRSPSAAIASGSGTRHFASAAILRALSCSSVPLTFWWVFAFLHLN